MGADETPSDGGMTLASGAEGVGTGPVSSDAGPVSKPDDGAGGMSLSGSAGAEGQGREPLTTYGPSADARASERTKAIDPPIQSDPLGNAIVGTLAGGVIAGAGAIAGGFDAVIAAFEKDVAKDLAVEGGKHLVEVGADGLGKALSGDGMHEAPDASVPSATVHDTTFDPGHASDAGASADPSATFDPATEIDPGTSTHTSSSFDPGTNVDHNTNVDQATNVDHNTNVDHTTNVDHMSVDHNTSADHSTGF
jgi:hypothetical protein